MEIATGRPEQHPTPLPVDASMSPGVQRPGLIQPGQLTGPTIPGRDVQGEYREQMAAAQAECEAAMGPGMSAENTRRDFYQADMVQSGPAEYGITMTLPEVPDNAVPPVSSDDYPFSGDEPVPSQAGFDNP